MIATVTMNATLDYVLTMPALRLGSGNSAEKVAYLSGGKGVNVSAMLRHLGVPTVCCGFLAGFVGEYIAQDLKEQGFATAFTMLRQGCTRINIKLRGNIDETDVSGVGATPTAEEMQQLLQQLSHFTPQDTVVFSGRLPPKASADTYACFGKKLAEKGIPFAVDSTGESLLQALNIHPLVIKPNHEELGELFGVTVQTPQQAAELARRLQAQGAQYVLVSMGKQGAVLVSPDGEAIFQPAPTGTVVNTSGAGDATLGGFLYSRQVNGLSTRSLRQQALRWAVSAGSATAFSLWIAEKEDVQALYACLPEQILL